jgi:CheY-like chemotaxis protein
MTTPLEVLLVEDNAGDVEMTLQALRGGSLPCHVSVANDGLEALQFLAKHDNYAQAPTPQLILLDLNMPRMDGKQFLEALKADEELKVIPVVMFTSSESSADIRECYKRYASCYVIKPFGGREFVNALQQVTSFWGNLGQRAR